MLSSNTSGGTCSTRRSRRSARSATSAWRCACAEKTAASPTSSSSSAPTPHRHCSRQSAFSLRAPNRSPYGWRLAVASTVDVENALTERMRKHGIAAHKYEELLALEKTDPGRIERNLSLLERGIAEASATISNHAAWASRRRPEATTPRRWSQR